MNWLLTNCAAPQIAPFGTGEKRPPLGIGFLASALRNAGHDVRFIDNYLRPSDFLETDYLNRHRIDAIEISASTICARDMHRMLGRLEQMRAADVWGGKVVVGGPHTTAVPDDIPEWVDHVVQGEGEEPIVRIAEGETERVLRTERTKDLDALAPPTWDLFARLPYDWTASWLRVAPVFTMNTSRGCPFKCTFCSTPDIWGRAYRYFSADWVIEQIRYLVNTYGAKGIYFREDNFSVHRKRITEFCEKLMRAGVDIQWVCETRVDTLRRDLLELMHRAGCRGIYVGVESGSQRVLDYMQKDIKLDEVYDIFRWCREIGIRTYASFVVGVPTETPEERAATVAMPEKIRATTHSMNVFVGVPTSRLYHHSAVSHMDTFDKLKQNVAAALDREELGRADWDAIHNYADATRSQTCDGCDHLCGPAVGGSVQIGNTLRYLMYHDTYGEPQKAKELFAQLPAEARNLRAVDFGPANKACPYGVDVAGHMKRASEVFHA